MIVYVGVRNGHGVKVGMVSMVVVSKWMVVYFLSFVGVILVLCCSVYTDGEMLARSCPWPDADQSNMHVLQYAVCTET